MVKEIKSAQLADLMRDYIAAWSARDLAGTFFSITQVTLTPDLQKAILWVDVLEEDQQKKVMSYLEKNQRRYQRQLNTQVSRYKVPEIIFKLDDRVRIGEHFDSLLKP